MNKILVEIYIPIIEEKYDVWLPKNKKIYNIIELLLKGIYELSKEEENKYRKEFNTLPYAKNLKHSENILNWIAIAGFIISEILSLFLDAMERSIPNLVYSVNWLCFVAIIFISIIFEWYGTYIFKRWLRIKYNIEYTVR